MVPLGAKTQGYQALRVRECVEARRPVAAHGIEMRNAPYDCEVLNGAARCVNKKRFLRVAIPPCADRGAARGGRHA